MFDFVQFSVSKAHFISHKMQDKAETSSEIKYQAAAGEINLKCAPIPKDDEFLT